MAVPVVLTIAGSDSGAGAGIQGDLKTFAALGVYGTSAITAITAQNTKDFFLLHPLSPAVVMAQVRAVLEDFAVKAIKIGMLANGQILQALCLELAKGNLENIVLDPVLCSKTGARLLEASAVRYLIKELLPLCSVCTPNVEEASELLGLDAKEVIGNPRAVCEAFLSLGTKVVVLKGGHAGGELSEDFFFDGKRFERLVARRELTKNTHGTGCAFSSAIAAYLACGYEVLEAVRASKQFISSTLGASTAFAVGSTYRPLNHLHACWSSKR